MAELEQALTGRMADHHRLLLRLLLDPIDDLNQRLTPLDGEIEPLLRPFDGDHLLERLDAIPGIDVTTARIIISEIGIDRSPFPTAEQLASWAGLAPTKSKVAASSIGRGFPLPIAIYVQPLSKPLKPLSAPIRISVNSIVASLVGLAPTKPRLPSPIPSWSLSILGLSEVRPILNAALTSLTNSTLKAPKSGACATCPNWATKSRSNHFLSDSIFKVGAGQIPALFFTAATPICGLQTGTNRHQPV